MTKVRIIKTLRKYIFMRGSQRRLWWRSISTIALDW